MSFSNKYGSYISGNILCLSKYCSKSGRGFMGNKFWGIFSLTIVPILYWLTTRLCPVLSPGVGWDGNSQGSAFYPRIPGIIKILAYIKIFSAFAWLEPKSRLRREGDADDQSVLAFEEQLANQSATLRRSRAPSKDPLLNRSRSERRKSKKNINWKLKKPSKKRKLLLKP